MKKKLFTLVISLSIISFLLTSCASPSLEITEIWGRPGEAGGNSAAYFMIKNNTLSKDSLLRASADIARAVELHMSLMSGEGEQQQMVMIPQESVKIPGLKTIEFKPGGLHVMFIDLAADLKPGDHYTLTLHFEKAGEIQLDVPVREP